ncbi:MAG: UDP-N-acetylglucosamine 2-epimerase (non-hydrolyzing) [Candidatus Eisenbacteria bacterium]
MIQVLVVIGTRPEAIKMFPVIRCLSRRSDAFSLKVCSVGQHREMLDQMLVLFGIEPDFELNVMTHDQSLNGIVSRALSGLERMMARERPDVVLLQGDTTAAFAAALTAFHNRIPVGHVEAGLRTGDDRNPFPEEMNRRLVSCVAEWHFAPTVRARENLLRENVDADRVFVTGNTVVDALMQVAAEAGERRETVLSDAGLLEPLARTQRFVIVTAHRRENFGSPLKSICRAVDRLAGQFEDVGFVFSVHRNPTVNATVRSLLNGRKNVVLTEPLPYDAFVLLMKECHLILTDSGGIQEEAPTFGKPVLVMREKTERPEAVEAGVARVVGTDADAIVEETKRLITNPREYEKMANARNPFGDGRAAERIAQILVDVLVGEHRCATPLTL